MNVSFTNFEDWIVHLFDHPEAHHLQEWYWQDDAPWWAADDDPVQAVRFMTQLFREPEILIGQYTAKQIGIAINYLISPGLSDHAFVLINPLVPLSARVTCIRHIVTLYERLFAKICPHYYGHLDDGPEPANGASAVCYMFWDLFPMFPRTKNELVNSAPEVKDFLEDHFAIEDACLIAMENILQSDHPACQEGALHGLGHWAHGYPAHVQAVIDRFLARVLTEEIRQYAGRVRCGCVL